MRVKRSDVVIAVLALLLIVFVEWCGVSEFAKTLDQPEGQRVYFDGN